MGLRAALTLVPSWGWWILGITLCRSALAAVIPLTPEEAYHWNFAVHLDWSYYDHPPMVAWGIAVGRLVFGDTPLGVRFVPLLFSAGTWFLAARLAETLFDARAASWTVFLLCLEPIVFAASGSAFPDSPLLFFWTLSAVLVWRALKTGRVLWWIGAGAAFGAAMVSKYTAVFLGPSILCYLLFSRGERKWLKTPWPYFAAIAAFVVFLPVLFWNATHDWVSLRYQSSGRLSSGDSINPIGGLKYLAQQAFGVLPLTFPLAAAVLYRGSRSRKEEDRFLFWLSIPLLLFFFFVSWKRSIHLMWPMPAFIAITLWMADSLSHGDFGLARWYARHRRSMAGIVLVAVVGGLLHLWFFLPWVSPYLGLYGWESAARRAEQLRSGLSDGSFYLGIGRKYVCPSQLAFHLGAPFDVNGKELLGHHGLQYDFWVEPDKRRKKDAVVVVQPGYDKPWVRKVLEERFGNVEPAGELVVPVGRNTLLETPPLRFTFLIGRQFQPRAGPGVSAEESDPD